MDYTFFKHYFKAKETLKANSLNELENFIQSLLKSCAKEILPGTNFNVNKAKIGDISLLGLTESDLDKLIGVRIDNIDYICPAVKLKEGGFISFMI